MLATWLLAGLLQAGAQGAPPAGTPAPAMEGWPRQATAQVFADHEALVAALSEAIDVFRREHGGATFGVDAATGEPMAFEDGVEVAILDMLRKAPGVGEQTRQHGGWLTAVFEFRPARQPADARLYIRASYVAREGRYELLRIVDPPGAPLREDITGMHVEMR